MLKSQGMSNGAIAHRLGVSEMAVRKLVGPSKPESEQLALLAIPTAAEKPAATGAPSATSTGEDGDRTTASAEENTADRAPVTAPETANDDGPVPAALVDVARALELGAGRPVGHVLLTESPSHAGHRGRVLMRD